MNTWCVMLDQLDFENLLNVALFLPAKDVLSFTSTNSYLRSLGSNPEFWTTLHEQHYGSLTTEATSAEARREYLLKAHIDCLESVRWHHIDSRCYGMDAREGHLACRLGNENVITGGFIQDPGVYMQRPGEPWRRIVPPEPPLWVYGATLTPLADGRRAVRFGGFQSGGYENETANVAVLHYDGNDNVRWERMNYSRTPAMEELSWNTVAARAYAATILLFDRYLLVVGGMKASGSILSPIILDTQTGRFLHSNITDNSGDIPSPRHGASIVEDIEHRGRLVMFGGGSGHDLLRSGRDNAEVWELNLNGCTSAEGLPESLPWRWKLIHRQEDSSLFHQDETMDLDVGRGEAVRLSLVEQLNLGRCHASFRLGRDSVLLAFGGRPSCNSVLVYRLATDTFDRPKVTGPLPMARFTFASISMADSGYILFQGGFCSHNAATTVDDMCVLDLAAGMRRPFELLPERAGVISHAPITNAQLADMRQRGRRLQDVIFLEDLLDAHALDIRLRTDLLALAGPSNEMFEGDDDDDDDDDDYLEDYHDGDDDDMDDNSNE